jgi:hypothetical protein
MFGVQPVTALVSTEDLPGLWESRLAINQWIDVNQLEVPLGHWATVGSDHTIIYYYIADNETLTQLGGVITSAGSFSLEELGAIYNAIQSYENIANIQFVPVSSAQEANIVWALVHEGDTFRGATSELDGSSNPNTTLLIQINADRVGAALSPGGRDFITFIHELGHALGITHAFDDGIAPGFPGATPAPPGVDVNLDGRPGNDYLFGEYNMNQGIYTTMSYNNGWISVLGGVSPSSDYGWQGTPMALDVAALQLLYGSNSTYHDGDNTYVLDHQDGLPDLMSTIWDVGGEDTISYSGPYNALIILEPATLEEAVHGGGHVSFLPGAPAESPEHFNAFTSRTALSSKTPQAALAMTSSLATPRTTCSTAAPVPTLWSGASVTTRTWWTTSATW